MEFYRVMLEGTGICIAGTGERAPITGFYATRVVQAASVDEAIACAQALVAREWESGAYRNANTGAPPVLEAEEVYAETLQGYQGYANSGYTFYEDDRGHGDEDDHG